MRSQGAEKAGEDKKNDLLLRAVQQTFDTMRDDTKSRIVLLVSTRGKSLATTAIFKKLNKRAGRIFHCAHVKKSF